MNILKLCIKCNTQKNIDEFGANSKTKDKKKPYCKECCKNINKQRYIDKKPEIIDAVLDWQESNPELVRKIQKKYRDKNK